jgi:protein-S-isoprenylcysteine O-methyltransferase Ste14
MDIKNPINITNIDTNAITNNLNKNKYIFILFFFLILLICLYVFNPFNIVKKYFTIMTFFTIFTGACLIAILLTYTNISSKDSLNDNTVRSLIYKYILNASFFILILAILGVLLFYIFKAYGNIQSQHSILSFFINLFIVVVFLSILYRFFDIGKYVKNSKFLQLIFNVIMYLPCLLIYLIETPISYLIPISRINTTNKSVKDIFNNEYNKTDIGTFILFIIMIVLLLIVIFYPNISEKIQLQGGTQIVNQTIYTNTYSSLFTIKQLTNMSSPDYEYGLSFWLYIDSEPPNTSSLYLTNGSVLNFADLPNILYNGIDNSLIFMQKYTNGIYVDASNGETDISMNEYGFHNVNNYDHNQLYKDISNNVIQLNKSSSKEIFRLKNIKLQKWNHIVLNLYNGTMDIFYNGELVKSQPGVVPYINMSDTLSIGSNNGISGGVCNVTFFDKPLKYTQIYYLYELFKNMSPPVIYKNINKTIVFTPNNTVNTSSKKYTLYGSETNTTILTQSPAIMSIDASSNNTNTSTSYTNDPTPFVMAPTNFKNILGSLVYYQ